MNPNFFQRVILRNQYEILSLIDSEKSNYYKKMVAALEGGYEAAYNNFNMDDDPFGKDNCELVLKTLRLFKILNNCFEELEEKEKQTIKEHDFKFQGYDANDKEEIDCLNYLTFILTYEDYSELLEKISSDYAIQQNYNSHRIVKPRYRSMLLKWSEMGEPSSIDINQFKKIISSN